MPKSHQVDAVLLEEPPTEPVFPPHRPGPASAFKKALAEVVDRFRLWFAKFPPLIESHPRIAWGTGIALVVAIAFGAWLLHRSGTTVPTSRQAAKIVRRQRASHKLQGNGVPTKARAAEIAKLENLARDAYKRAHYVLPVETSALTYSKRVLKLDPSNNYSRTMLENSVNGGKYQVHQALKRKDFAQAHRVANAMAQLLPGRKDIATLKQDIRIAEGGTTASRPQKAVAGQKAVPKQKAGGGQKAVAGQKAVPHPKAVPTVSFSAYHLHSNKAPADHGPYCLGILSVSGHHLKFSGQSASQGQKVHKLDVPCSDVREIKKNPRIASRQGGFHVRTASKTINFAARDSSLKHIAALASACSK